jgi:uncharacterized membrane protein
MDDLESLFWLIVVIAIIVRYIVTTRRFSGLRHRAEAHAHEIAAMGGRIAALEQQIATASPAQAEPPKEAAASEAAASVYPPTLDHEPVKVTPPAAGPAAPIRPPVAAPESKIKPKHIEQQFGGRAFVWVGGVALALAGFYLVKYSIDTGLLTERVRITLGLIFGVALLAGSYVVRARVERIANGVRIGQALAGAGIADLYGSLFAATTLYHLVPPWLGFGAMAATTAVALVLSLRHGMPIALLGLIGGYATPAMIEGEPNAPLLFGYLYLVFIALSVVARGRNWWWLSVPATLVAFAWVILWLTGAHSSHDAAVLSSFLLAIGITAVAVTPRRAESEDVKLEEPQTWARFIAPTGAIVLAGVVAYTADFGFFEWGMFGLFSLGAIGLAVFDGRTYVAVPWIAMAVNLAMLAGWNGEASNVAIVLSAFAVVFTASGQVFLTRSYQPLSWAGLSAAASIAYFLLAYDKLKAPLAKAMNGNVWLTADAAWTAIAFACAIAMTAAVARPFVLGSETALRQRLQAIFVVAATALVSIGLAILLHEEYLSFAVAVEILVIAGLRTRTDIPALRYLGYVLSAQFALLLLPNTAWTLAGAVAGNVPLATARWLLVTTALFRYALPAILFAIACRFLRAQKDEPYATGLELGAIALLTVAVYKLLEAAFLGHPSDAALVVGGIFTNIVLSAGVAGLYFARSGRYGRTPLWAGLALLALGVARVVGLSLLVFNPLWSHQAVGPLPLLNGLLAIYALPSILLFFAARELKQAPLPQAGILSLGVSLASYLLGFFWLSLAVRQIFNGAHLDNGVIVDAEAYTYSAVWLMLAIALLVGATLRKDATMRYASLAVMLLTVGKVFLYDASQLTGLWRVVSFLGLGLSLLGLSWFYSRFIFASEKPEPAS